MTEGNFASPRVGFSYLQGVAVGHNDSRKNEEFQLLSHTEMVGLLLLSFSLLTTSSACAPGFFRCKDLMHVFKSPGHSTSLHVTSVFPNLMR
mgnify:CR=1 FL=1